jgi:hypothetical protein
MKKDNNDNTLSKNKKGQKTRFEKEAEALKANLEKRKLQIEMRKAQKNIKKED